MHHLKIFPLLLVAATAALLIAFGLHIKNSGSISSTLIVDTIQRSIDHTTASMGCETLALSPKDAETYFSTATEVSAARFDAESIILPCSFSGTLTKGGIRYAWRIHAAGAGYLTAQATSSETKRFLCEDACEKALPALMGR